MRASSGSTASLWTARSMTVSRKGGSASCHRAGGARAPRRVRSDANDCGPVRARLRGVPRARPGSRPADERPLGSWNGEDIADRSFECRHLQDTALHANVNRYFDSVEAGPHRAGPPLPMRRTMSAPGPTEKGRHDPFMSTIEAGADEYCSARALLGATDSGTSRIRTNRRSGTHHPIRQPPALLCRRVFAFSVRYDRSPTVRSG